MASSAENRRVLVRVKTKFWLDGEDEQEIELSVFGRFYKKQAAYYLQYEEEHEQGKMNTVVKLTDGDAAIIRNGLLKMRMYFREKDRLEGLYETPYGKLPIFTKTTRYEHLVGNEESVGTVNLHYDLFMDGTRSGSYHLQLTYEEANDEHR